MAVLLPSLFDDDPHPSSPPSTHPPSREEEEDGFDPSSAHIAIRPAPAACDSYPSSSQEIKKSGGGALAGWSVDNIYWVMDHYRLTIQLGLLGTSILCLWFFIDVCVWCIMLLALVSCIFCFEYRLMNIVLWACMIVLWLHGWTVTNGRGLTMEWK